MSEPNEKPSTSDELEFFGTITASLCHELKNVFATIGELSGLMCDLGCASGSTGRLSPEKLQSICGRIEHQVDRGEEYSRLLSRFAHSVDEPVVERVDLNELVTETVDLCRRFGYLARVTLETVVPEVPIVATLSPYACRHAVFRCIRLALRSAAERRVIKVSLQTGDAGPTLVVASADPFDQASANSAELALLESIVAQLGGRTSWIGDHDSGRVVLQLH